MNTSAEYEVLIVGAGPTGLTLANLLGQAGVNTLLIERNAGCVPEPRAVALDGESLRTLQAVGLAEMIQRDLHEGFIADYVNGEGTELFRTDLRARPYGFCLQNTFDQPRLELQLLKGARRFACVTIRHSTPLIGFEEHADAVQVTLADGEGGEDTVRCRYLVGCDGGRSGVREALGIALSGERLPQRWLVLDTIDKAMGDAPECRFFCDPKRPGMTIMRPHGERRWEWMLLPDERDEDLLADGCIANLLAPYTDMDQVTVYRKCVYGFSAVVAEHFRRGRCFLAGDSAHMTPPFAGQGLNAGLRDARNLSWKLAAVISGSLPETLLDTYGTERHEAAQQMVELAVALGAQIQPTDAAQAAERDAFFAELNRDPAAAAKFGQDLVAPLSQVALQTGWFTAGGGRFLPQPAVQMNDGEVLLDNLLGNGFIALYAQGAALPAALTAHPLWLQLDPQMIAVDEAQWRYEGGLLKKLGLAHGEILLLRPDRFVLAQLPCTDDAAGTLTALAQAISD